MHKLVEVIREIPGFLRYSFKTQPRQSVIYFIGVPAILLFALSGVAARNGFWWAVATLILWVVIAIGINLLTNWAETKDKEKK